MDWRSRRFVGYVAAFVAIVVMYAVLYQWGMAVFEGERRSFARALLVVTETFTTTGYGEDAATWTTGPMIGLIVVMQFTGVVFIFTALPLFVVPWMEERLSTNPPTALEGLSDHVVVCSYTPRTEMLVEELEAMGRPYVIVQQDRETATALHEAERNVVHGDPESTETLRNVSVSEADAVVADVDDETNASVALAVEEICADGAGPRVISFVEDPDLAEYNRYAGVDDVLLPRQLVGESLASKVTTSVSAEVGDAIEIGSDFEIVEFPVEPGSDLAGVRLADSGLREEAGVNVIGAWFQGEFVMPPSPEDVIDERTVLLVAGHEDQLADVRELARSRERGRGRDLVVVCGYGEVGSTVKSAVTSAGLECTAIDVEQRPGVDVVGDVTEAETFRESNLADASTVVMALSNDTQAVFATLVARQIAPDVEIVARANELDSVRRIYRAGADYVLALGKVSGRMLASTVLDEDVLSYDQQIEVVRMGIGSLAGRTVESAHIRERTGCTVIAIERDGDLVTEFGPDFEFRDGDRVIVAGPDEGIVEFGTLVE